MSHLFNCSSSSPNSWTNPFRACRNGIEEIVSGSNVTNLEDTQPALFWVQHMFFQRTTHYTKSPFSVSKSIFLKSKSGILARKSLIRVTHFLKIRVDSILQILSKSTFWTILYFFNSVFFFCNMSIYVSVFLQICLLEFPLKQSFRLHHHLRTFQDCNQHANIIIFFSLADLF